MPYAPNDDRTVRVKTNACSAKVDKKDIFDSLACQDRQTDKRTQKWQEGKKRSGIQYRYGVVG